MNLLEVADLRFTWPDGTEALRGASLTLAAGASLGLIGRNGAGKSTLLLHLNGILHGSGAVRVRGRAVEDWPADELRATVGLAFEDPADQPSCPLVLEDGLRAAEPSGFRRRRRGRALAALRLVGRRSWLRAPPPPPPGRCGGSRWRRCWRWSRNYWSSTSR